MRGIGLGWRAYPEFWLGQHSNSWEESDGCRSASDHRYYLNKDGTKHGGMRPVSMHSQALQIFLDATHDDIFEEYNVGVMAKLGGSRMVAEIAAGFSEDVFDSISAAGKEDEVADMETEDEQLAIASYAASVLARMHEQMRETKEEEFHDDAEIGEDEEGRWDVTTIEAVVALAVLRQVAPRVGAMHHNAVAALVSGDDDDLAGMAMHTLGCLGPQAVAEHFDAMVARLAKATNDTHGPRWGRRSRRGIDGAALLAFCVLEPEHLQRLEARGAPSFLDVIQVINEDDGTPAVMFGAPDDWDSCTGLIENILERMAGLPDAPRMSNAEIVTDPASMLTTFTSELPRWSPGLHAAFPEGARARAVELLMLGYQLQARHGYLSSDVWVSQIMPLAIDSHSKPGGLRAPTPPSAFAAELARRQAAAEARKLEEEAAIQRKRAQQEAKKERKRARVEGVVDAAPAAGPPPAQPSGSGKSWIKCMRCNESPFASACQHKCCGKCCPGPCGRHKR